MDRSYHTQAWLLSDNSGYFLNGRLGSTGKICKYIFSSSQAQCQIITNIYFGFSPLMLSDTQFFFIGHDLSNYFVHVYKIKFSSTSLEWANKIEIYSQCWSVDYSESVLSDDSSTIYSFFVYGQTLKSLYFTSFSASTGDVTSTRYKSSVSIAKLSWGIALSDDYIVANTEYYCYLIVYKISSSTFIIKSFAGFALYRITSELPTGR